MPGGFVQFVSGQFSTPPLPRTPLDGQTILITGANSGLGLDAAKHLARLKCSTIIISCRTLAKAEQAKSDILSSLSKENSYKPTILIREMDMSSFASVAKFADSLSETRLDAAILNAAVYLRSFSLSEGYETSLTVNIISTFLLAVLLIPHLRRSALNHQTTPRLAIVGSHVHYWADTKLLTQAPQGQIFKSLSTEKSCNFPSTDRYTLTKLPVMLLVRHLASILTASAQAHPNTKPLVIVNNVHPGYCDTGLFRDDDTMGNKIALKIMGRSSEHGSRTLVHGAAAGKETHGEYLGECAVKKASPFVLSEEGRKTGQRIWNESVEIFERVRPGCTREL